VFFVPSWFTKSDGEFRESTGILILATDEHGEKRDYLPGTLSIIKIP